MIWLLQLGCTQRVHPPDRPAKDPSNAWAKLLNRVVDETGAVDYDLLQGERGPLDDYVAWVAEHGPLTDVMSEGKEKGQIAFMVNAYNALVLYGVLEHWPLDSVRDVSIGPYRFAGAGFFAGQTFRVDGAWRTLYHLETKLILARYQNAQLHMALNCASKGCPPLRFWRAKTLDNDLYTASVAFLESDQGLRWDGDQLEATELLQWYEKDFLQWEHAESLCTWMERYTNGPVQSWLVEHRETCPLTYFSYDWRLNGQ